MERNEGNDHVPFRIMDIFLRKYYESPKSFLDLRLCSNGTFNHKKGGNVSKKEKRSILCSKYEVSFFSLWVNLIIHDDDEDYFKRTGEIRTLGQ